MNVRGLRTPVAQELMAPDMGEGMASAENSLSWTQDVIEWLLEGDPAIRWQVLADLKGAAGDEVAAERARVASDGWGAQLLAAQDEAGTWAHGLYLPKWTSTTYTLLLLRWLGLPAGNPQAVRGCRCLWEGATYTDGGLNLVYRAPETCVTGMLVLLASYFRYQDSRIDTAVTWLLRDQLADGGWNCRATRTGSRHGSFHTSITVLEALLAYRFSGGAIDVREASERGRAFFLLHHLYRSHRTGQIAKEEFTRFPFPRNGISIFSADLSTSGQADRLPTPASQTQWKRYAQHWVQTADGSAISRIPAGSGSRLNRPARAALLPCGAFAC